MRYPQLLLYESDGRLAELLRPTARARHWLLREPRRPESCLRLLRRGGPAVLVLRMGRDLECELTLLEQVTRLAPDTATIVFTEREGDTTIGLAWDLGASYVLTPSQPRELLTDLVIGLMPEDGNA